MENNINNAEEVTPASVVHEGDKKRAITINPKTAVIFAAVIIIAAALFHYRSVFVVATVNGSPITRVAVVRELERRSGKPALELLITRKLITDAATKQGIVVTDEEITTEVKRLEEQASKQNTTLDAMIATQGLSHTDLLATLRLQKQVEKLLGDKIAVTDAEVDQFIKDQKITLPKDDASTTRMQIRDGLKNQKMTGAAEELVATLKKSANITYFLNYP